MNQIQLIIKYALFGIFLYLFVLILTPFFTSIVFAVLFAVIFYPFYYRLTKKFSPHLSALLIVVITTIAILTPLALFIGLVAREAFHLAANFNAEEVLDILKKYQNVDFFGYTFNLSHLQENLQQGITSASNTIYGIASDIGTSIMSFGFLFFVFLFLYYFLLRDGVEILKKVKTLLPFEKKQNKLLLDQCKTIAKTVFVGNASAALIAGLFAFLAFYIFGVPGALIWAILTAILSLIPTIGTFFVYLICGLIAAYLSGYGSLIGLLIYFIVMDLIVRENIIKPKLLDAKLAVHPILVFFAIVGGVQAFGSVGLLYGPLIIILFITMFDFVVTTRAKV